jgi:hypothetical protein
MLTFGFRPPTFLTTPATEDLLIELDRAIPRIYDAHNALIGIAVQAPALNGTFAMQTGAVTVTGSKLSIATGLATVTQVVVSIVSAVATNFTVTARPSPLRPGAIDVYVWKPTSSSVTTPVAGTTPVTIHWWASGTSKLT